MEDCSLPNNRVDKIRVAIKLVLNDVVEDFKQEKDQVIITVVGVQKPWSREGFH